MNDEGSEIKQNGHTLPKTLTFAVWKEGKFALENGERIMNVVTLKPH